MATAPLPVRNQWRDGIEYALQPIGKSGDSGAIGTYDRKNA